MTWGRPNATCILGKAKDFPQSEGGLSEVIKVQNRFGLTPEEVTALMGLHGIGRMQAKNSGHPRRRREASWVSFTGQILALSSNRLRSYFKTLIDVDWLRVKYKSADGQAREEWPDSFGNVYLKSDMALFFDLTGGCILAGGSATMLRLPGHCKRYAKGTAGDPYAIAVEKFKRGTSQYFPAFSRAWVKLTTKGFSNLLPIGVTPPASSTASGAAVTDNAPSHTLFLCCFFVTANTLLSVF